jgi:hypothetical protein
VRDWVNDPIKRTIDPFDWTGQIEDSMKPPDMSGPLDAQQKALEDEKRRRATEANRRDLQGSQLARLFFSQMGTQDETFNFMGL